MAKIRLPKTRPDVGVSPIPQIAPTTADPGAVLAGGLIGIGGQLADQEMRRRAKEKSETFAQYNQAIGEATTILNDDGSLNVEASIEASEAFAVNPEASIAGVLGDENASSLLADKDFSLTEFRLGMSRRKDKLLSSQALSYNEEILTLSQDPDLGLYGRDVIEDAMRRQSEAIARIDDSEYKANALNNAVTKQRAFNSIEQSAMAGGMQTAIEFFADVFEGEYDFLNPNKFDLLEDANKYVASQVAASTTISGGTNSLSVSGFNEFDFNTGKSISTIQAESLSKNIEALPPELRALQAQITQLMEADKVSKDTASYIFGSLSVDKNAVSGTMSANDLSLAISEQFLPRVQELTGLAQQDYIQKTFLKAQQVSGTIPDLLKQTTMQLATQPRTALSVIRALTKTAFISNDPNDPLRISSLLTPEESYQLKSLEAHIQRVGMNVEAGLQEYLNKKERKGALENLGIAPYKDEEQELLKKHLEDLGFGDLTVTADSLIDLETFASLKYTETMMNDATMDTETAMDLATSFAVNSFAASGIIPMFGRLENGPSPEYFQEAGAANLTAKEKGEYIEGAFIRALNDIGFPATAENMSEYNFIMTEEFVPEKVGAGNNIAVLNRKVRVMVEVDGNLVGTDENNRYQTDPNAVSKPFMFYLTPDDFYEYKIPEEQKKLKEANLGRFYNSYEKLKKQGANEEEMVSRLKQDLLHTIFHGYVNRFVKTDENGNPLRAPIAGRERYQRYGRELSPRYFTQTAKGSFYATVLEQFKSIKTEAEIISWAEKNMTDPLRTVMESSQPNLDEMNP